MATTRSTSVDARLSALEASQETLRHDIERVNGGLVELGNEMRTAFSQVQESLARRSQTPWGVLGTWAGVVLGFGSLIGGLVSFGLVDKINALQDTVAAHAALEGHPGAMVSSARLAERINGLETASADTDKDVAALTADTLRRVETMDTSLQREMRDLDAAGSAKVTGLDERLQKEMLLMQSKTDTRLEEVARRLGVIESVLAERANADVGLNAAQWEAIRALERAFFGKRGAHATEAPGAKRGE